MPLDLPTIRQQFPALQRPIVFLDNPGGTQICRQSIERITRYLVESNANHGGAFPTSRQSDALVEQARAMMADFINAARPEEIVIGANMTTLTYTMSRALGRTFNPGDTIVVMSNGSFGGIHNKLLDALAAYHHLPVEHCGS